MIADTPARADPQNFRKTLLLERDEDGFEEVCQQTLASTLREGYTDRARAKALEHFQFIIEIRFLYLVPGGYASFFRV